jgi:hypothetical protein
MPSSALVATTRLRRPLGALVIPKGDLGDEFSPNFVFLDRFTAKPDAQLKIASVGSVAEARAPSCTCTLPSALSARPLALVVPAVAGGGAPGCSCFAPGSASNQIAY